MFTDVEFMTARDKELVLRDWTKFLEQGLGVSGGVKTHESRRLENVNELGGMSGQDAGMVG